MSESSTNDDYSSRANALQSWFREILPGLATRHSIENFRIKLIKGDASFRRYYRAVAGEDSFILVDAPPQKENSHPFVLTTKLYEQAGVRVPTIHVADLERGFLCLSDFGDTLLWEKLYKAQQTAKDKSTASRLYQLAFDQLQKIQSIRAEDKLPVYSEHLLLEEMELFRHWFCEKLLGLRLDMEAEKILQWTFRQLIESARAQPQVSVHRDFHSRNLMVLDDSQLGVIDYQDAVVGPLTYDLVSLLKDCYIAWPRQQALDWALTFLQTGVNEEVNKMPEAEFIKAFDLMGAQRHLKAIGIFSRLYLRDQKINYLGDIPRTLSYLSQLQGEYEELNDFLDWLKSDVLLDIEDKIVAAISLEPSV